MVEGGNSYPSSGFSYRTSLDLAISPIAKDLCRGVAVLHRDSRVIVGGLLFSHAHTRAVSTRCARKRAAAPCSLVHPTTDSTKSTLVRPTTRSTSLPRGMFSLRSRCSRFTRDVLASLVGLPAALETSRASYDALGSRSSLPPRRDARCARGT